MIISARPVTLVVHLSQEDQHEPLLNSFSQLKDVLCSVAGMCSLIDTLMPPTLAFIGVIVNECHICILHWLL